MQFQLFFKAVVGFVGETRMFSLSCTAYKPEDCIELMIFYILGAVNGVTPPTADSAVRMHRLQFSDFLVAQLETANPCPSHDLAELKGCTANRLLLGK